MTSSWFLILQLSFLTVCKDWHRLQWPSLKRLHTTATAWVVTRVTAVLKHLKTQAFIRAKKFWCRWFHGVQLCVWNVTTFLFHHVNEIINSTAESFLHSSASHELPYLSNITYILFHNSSTLGHSPSQCNGCPHTPYTHLHTDHPRCLFPLVSPSIFLHTLIARICNTQPIILDFMALIMHGEEYKF